jgi:N-acetylneuraminic acid mutarotase
LINRSRLFSREGTVILRFMLRLAAFAFAMLVVSLAPQRSLAPVSAHAGSGAWTSGPSLSVARVGHTATSADIAATRIVVAGGRTSGTPGSSTAVYDVATGGWIVAASMGAARANHTATLLSGGEILAAGGLGASALASAELFDVATLTWAPTAAMAEVRYSHTAVRLQDDRVLVAGGTTGATFSRTGAELYSPALNTWSTADSMSVGRREHAATLLPDGRVLVTGGLANGSTSPTASVEIYDPGTDAWTAASGMGLARARHTATLLSDGRVLVTGGVGPSGATATAEVYDSTNDNWSPVASLTDARESHAALLLPGGLILVAGGLGTSLPLSSAELYNSFANNWSAAGTVSTARSGVTASNLSNGQVLAIGGFANGLSQDAVDIFEPGAWETRASMIAQRTDHTTTVLNDGRVLVAGGLTPGGVTSSVEIYDPELDTWTAAASMTGPRQRHTATPLRDGRVFVAGGLSGTAMSTALNTAEVYDPVAGTWTAVGNMTTARVGHAAARLVDIPVALGAAEPGDGRVLVLGGSNGTSPIASGAIYNAQTNTWSSITTMPAARMNHVALSLEDGKVLAAGGSDGVAPSVNTYMWNPHTGGGGTWSLADPMATARENHAAIRFLDNHILVAGGTTIGGATLDSTEIYDPAADAWSNAGSMSDPRTSLALRGTSTGLALAFGGSDGVSPLDTVDRYDPHSNSWHPVADMGAARAGHGAVLLLDGHVLATGGASTGSAEAYNGSAAITDPGPQFIFPIECTINADCWYHNYVDEDRETNAVLDWACGSFSYNTHEGTDIPLLHFAQQDHGVDVIAADGGIVIFTEDGNFDRNTAWSATARSNAVVIMHPSGLATGYFHLRNGSVSVEVGEVVSRGQRLGQVASSGSSTGPHLHFQVYDLSVRFVDPWSNTSGSNCGGDVSLWIDQAPYENFFLQLDHFLQEPPLDLQSGESVAALAPDATHMCYTPLLLSPNGTSATVKFVGPTTTLEGTFGMGFGRSWSATLCRLATLFTPDPGTWRAEFWHGGNLMSWREFAVCQGTCLTGVHRGVYTSFSAPSTFNNCTAALTQVGDGSGPNGIGGTMDCTTAHGGTITSGTLNQGVSPKQLDLVVSFTNPPLIVDVHGEVSDDGTTGDGDWDCVPTCAGATYEADRLPANAARRINAQVGGIVSTAFGDQLILPPGSLATDTLISFEVLPLSPAPTTGTRSISRMFEIGPSGTQFDPSATLVVQYTDEDLVGGVDPTALQVMYYDSVLGWVWRGGVVDTIEQTVTIDLDHLSAYALFDCRTGMADTDGDALGNVCDIDDDDDGCSDFEEQAGNQSLGGLRDPLDRWDFFDVPAPAGPALGADGKPILTPASARNTVVTLQDVGVILAYVGRVTTNSAYTADNNGDGYSDGEQMDRTLSSYIGQPWRSGPPNGGVSLQDVGIALTQVGNTCFAAP